MHREVRRIAREARRRGGAKKACDGARRRGRDVGRIGNARAPGLSRQINAEERIERDFESPRLNFLDAALDRLIRRRAAVARLPCRILADRDEAGSCQRHIGDAPAVGPAGGQLEGAADIGRGGIDLAARGVERIGEPLHDDGDGRAIRQRRLELVERIAHVRARSARRVIGVDGREAAAGLPPL
jgi:hypothetical protein